MKVYYSQLELQTEYYVVDCMDKRLEITTKMRQNLFSSISLKLKGQLNKK